MRPTATPTANGSAKRAPVRLRDAGDALVDLDRHDRARDRPLDRAGDPGHAARATDWRVPNATAPTPAPNTSAAR